MKRACLGWVGLLCLCLCAIAAAQSLPAPLARAARSAGLKAEDIGVVVWPVEAGKARLSVNAKRAMNPASTMKLVTTAAALHLLGPSHTWRTEAFADGSLQAGTLKGNLVLKGSGDPKLTLEEFWILLQRLRARGLIHIAGDVVLDKTVFAPVTGSAGDFDGDGLRPYNALPDGLLVNFNAVRLDFVPRAETRTVDILMWPPLPAIQLDNRLQLADSDCHDWPQDPAHTPGEGRLVFEGAFPVACGETTRNYSPLPATRYIDALFRMLWQELGGTLTGTIREGSAPVDAAPLTWLDSEPLAEIIRDINKFSNNVMARQVFLALGAAGAPPPFDTQKATQALQLWLSSQSLDFAELILDNGSGLSRTERISPLHLATLLKRMARSPFAPEFLASLPLSGLDGTMKRRLNDSAVAGRAHIKTGYLQDVRASAGYVLDAKDRLVVVVCLVNGSSAGDSKPFHDAVIEWAYQAEQKKPCCQK